MNIELQFVREQLNNARKPEDVFGELKGDSQKKIKAAKSIYRNLVKATHEDLFPDKEKPVARETFIVLEQWWTEAQVKIKNDTYGDNVVIAKAKPSYQPIEMMVRKKKLVLDNILAQGAFSTVYSATYDGIADKESVFVKVARTPQDNELLENEYDNLRLMHAKDDNPNAEEFFKKQRHYIPRPIGSFFISGKNNTKHRATILSIHKGTGFTIETLRNEKFPNGIEPKHCYWMYRRLLLTLWMAHLKGIVHGAPTPEHILVYPKEHGLILLDWTCSTKIGKKVQAFNPKYKSYYAPEIFEKKEVSSASDIYTATQTMLYMIKQADKFPATVNKKVETLLMGCLDKNPKKRPQDAELFHNEFGSALGKREFVEFIVT